MGKATRWFKGLFGLKRDKDEANHSQTTHNTTNKKRWSFGVKPAAKAEIAGGIPAALSASDTAWIRSYLAGSSAEQNKHAIAVAAATAAAADAAVAAAQAAVAVVRLTSQGAAAAGRRDRWAAAKIQAVFRGYLARKALRALKGLVKIQALVRGFLVRKRAAATLHSMQALIRAQTAVRTQRARRSFNKENHRSTILLESHNPRKSLTSECEFHSKRVSGNHYDADDNNSSGSPKIVEIDTCRPRSRRFAALSECGVDHPPPSPGMRTCVPVDEYYYDYGHDCRYFSTAHSTPRLANVAMWGSASPATPAKSVCAAADYYYPNYMATTQSFNAKLRSHSAPKQRPEPGPKKRLSLNEILAARNSISGVRMHKSYAQFPDEEAF